MLFLAPYEVPKKKAKKTVAGTRKGLRRKVALDVTSEDTKTHSNNEDEEEEEEITPPPTGGIRGRPPHKGRPRCPRRERPSFRTIPP